MSDGVSFDVVGRPAPQGSKRHVGGGRMIEMSRHVKPWRAAVQVAATAARRNHVPFTGPVRLDVIFRVARPKSHHRTGRYAHLLRPNAPAFPAVVPDLSKLVRATEDAITDAGLWADDALVAEIVAAKRYADATPTGARITIRPLTPGHSTEVAPLFDLEALA